MTRTGRVSWRRRIVSHHRRLLMILWLIRILIHCYTISALSAEASDNFSKIQAMLYMVSLGAIQNCHSKPCALKTRHFLSHKRLRTQVDGTLSGIKRRSFFRIGSTCNLFLGEGARDAYRATRTLLRRYSVDILWFSITKLKVEFSLSNCLSSSLS